MQLNDNQIIGLAGQYLTCADLIIKGFIAYPAAEGLPYDVVLDGKDCLLKVQVKTCWQASSRLNEPAINKVYTYNFQHGRGKYVKGRYGKDEVDIFALVALDVRKVGYIKLEDAGTALRFRSEASKGSYQTDKTVKLHNDILNLKAKGLSGVAISKELGISDACVYDHLRNSYKLVDSSDRYFSSIERNSEWFWGIINVKK